MTHKLASSSQDRKAVLTVPIVQSCIILVDKLGHGSMCSLKSRVIGWATSSKMFGDQHTDLIIHG